jgi:hypothetical protein
MTTNHIMYTPALLLDNQEPLSNALYHENVIRIYEENPKLSNSVT